MTPQKTNNYNTRISNISRSKGNQAKKFGQLMQYKKTLYEIKASVQHLNFNIFW